MPELKQELVGNERGVRLFKDGKFLGYEDVHEVSDEQLERDLKDQAREEAIEEITAKKLIEIKARIKEK